MTGNELERIRASGGSVLNEMHGAVLAGRQWDGTTSNAMLSEKFGIELGRRTVDLLGRAMDEYTRQVARILSEEEKLPSELKNALKDDNRAMKQKNQLWVHTFHLLLERM